ncbi:conjugal transfer protein TraD [Flavobacterium poyangense]|uniref:conjugal transfer protein TraD n=1 Tax=Flavobacterium poyangense TaxID=2204302 RepID=UPI00141F1332|nr:conjugal transfer protein TraD [Flavobacterium sp. JXAS1]
METVIVICLLIIIVLLLQDKTVIRKRSEPKPPQEKINPSVPSIMGLPKAVTRHSIPNVASECQSEEAFTNPSNLDIEYDENENVPIQIPQEELDNVFRNVPDFEQEEEEWKRYSIANDEYGLALGVTFEELSSVGMLLQQNTLDSSQKETALALVHKIQGTELFTLLENSKESVSRKIAELLDNNLLTEAKAGSSSSRKSDLNNFDIQEFI